MLTFTLFIADKLNVLSELSFQLGSLLRV